MSRNVSSQGKEQSWNYVIRSGLAGGIAGCVAKTVVAPLDRVKILFQASNPDFQKYAGSWSGAFRAGGQIYRDGGFRGLFQGHSVTLLRVFPYAAIKFMAYDQVRFFLIPSKEKETNVRRFLAGSISGMLSVCFTYPLDVIRVRMAFHTRAVNMLSDSSRPSLTKALSTIWHEGAGSPAHGASGVPIRHFDRLPLLKFYRGFSATLIGMIPYAGVSFLSWEYLRSELDRRSDTGRRSSSLPVDLAVGAISGVTAQTVSYPFEVIRRRMQVGGITSPDRWLRWGETVRAIWNANGWKGFYVGLSIGYLKMVPMTAVSFAVWQSGKRLLVA